MRGIRTLLWFSAVLAAAACDDGDGDSDEVDDSFECTAATAGWQQCTDNMVQWCHLVSADDAHFHWGANCEDLGLTCTELSAAEAVCVDTASSCTPGEAKCEQGAAFNCLADGHWAVEPCTGDCQMQGTEAVCEAACSLDPQDACDAMAATPESKQVTEVFSAVFSEDTHADIGVPVEVTLPDQALSYIHFPVTSSGEHLVFLDTAGVLDTILDADETDQLPAGGSANSACPDELTDHYHADLDYSGSGGDPVPFVLRFKAVPTQTVTLIVLPACSE